LPSAYDDEIWSLVPEERSGPPPAVRRLVSELGPVPRALDLGCGDGRTAELLEAGDLVLVDVSDVALARAAKRLPGARAVLVEPDRALPLPDNAFELVLCTDTVEHVRDVSLLLSEARRVLVPGGRLALSTPAHGRLTGLDVLVRGFERRFDPLSPHLRFFTRGSLGGLLGGFGFAVEEMGRDAGTLVAVATR